MAERHLFPASIVDELTYCVEKTDKNPLIQGWIFTLEGEVCSRTLQAALDTSLNYYPKFKCLIVKNYPSLKRWFRYCWEYRDIKSRDVFQEIEDHEPSRSNRDATAYYIQNHFALSMDIDYQSPLKVLLIRQPKQASLIFVFHHAAVDGIGGSFFIQKFIQFYEDIFYQRKKEDEYPPDFKSISQPEIKFRWYHFSPKCIYSYLKYTALLRKEPAAQLHPQGEEEGTRKFLAVVREIPPQQFKTIRTISKNYQATINDHLLASMFQTIKKWNAKWTDKSERIYITVPLNLRSPEDRTMGNILSGFNISLRSESIGKKVKTVRLVQEDLTSMLKNDIARTTVNLAWFLKLIPLKIKLLFYKHLPQIASPTFSLSNLGVFSPNSSHKDEKGFHYMGPARICSITGIPPAGQWVGMAVFTYNNRMALSLTALSSQFSSEAAGELLDSFIGELIE